MTRETEEALTDFVALQAVNFALRKWTANPHPTGASLDELAMIALFLTQTTFGHEIPRPAWFNYPKELIALFSGQDLFRLAEETRFEPSRFAAMLDAALDNNPVWRAHRWAQ